MEAMSFVTEDRKTPQESVSPNTYTFDLFGGVDVSDALHGNLCSDIFAMRALLLIFYKVHNSHNHLMSSVLYDGHLFLILFLIQFPPPTVVYRDFDAAHSVNTGECSH